MYFEAVANARLFLAAAEHAGVARDRILKEARIPAARIDPPSLHIPWPEMVRLLTAAERLTGDHHIGLHAGSTIGVAHCGVPIQYVINQPRLIDAVRIGFQTIMPRWTNVVRTELHAAGAVTQLRFVPQLPLVRAVRQLLDFYFHLPVNEVRAYICGDWSPVEMRVQGCDSGIVEEYERMFRCPVKLDADHNELVIENEVLLHPRPAHEPELNAWLEPIFNDHLAAMERDLASTVWVRDHVALSLHSGKLQALEEIAHGLRHSKRTLQQHLRREGTSYREVVDGVRKELAMVWLAHSSGNVDQVSSSLGFSESVAFIRAFRRWTGVTPAQWRRNSRTPHLVAPPADCADWQEGLFTRLGGL